MDKGDKIIDSRDVIKRISELEDERETWIEDKNAQEEIDLATGPALWAEENPDEAQELAALESLQEQAEGYAPDWRHGATLIRADRFEEYAREFAEDIHGSEMRAASWPFDCIDWTKAADALQMDYTTVDFDGEEYLIR